MVSTDLDYAIAWLERFRGAVADQVNVLTELDRLAGDGDFGENLYAALDRAHDSLAAEPDDQRTIAGVFGHLATAFLSAGGTSGPLLGTWFRELARSTRDQRSLGTAQLAEGLTNGTERVQKLGGAVVGDCTMVDAMVPAVQALANAATAGMSPPDALALAARLAALGADSTGDLIAKKGRASYLGMRSQQVQDPGARAIAMFFEAAPDGS